MQLKGVFCHKSHNLIAQEVDDRALPRTASANDVTSYCIRCKSADKSTIVVGLYHFKLQIDSDRRGLTFKKGNGKHLLSPCQRNSLVQQLMARQTQHSTMTNSQLKFFHQEFNNLLAAAAAPCWRSSKALPSSIQSLHHTINIKTILWR